MVKHSSALRTTKLLASCRLLPDRIRLTGLPDCPKTRRILPFAKPELTGAHAAQKHAHSKSKDEQHPCQHLYEAEASDAREKWSELAILRR
jgi:hypothetical protein